MLQKPNPQQQNDVPDTSEAAFKKWMAEVDIAVGARLCQRLRPARPALPRLV
jgi:hypothetical protein